MTSFSRRQALFLGIGSVSALFTAPYREAFAKVGDEKKVAEGVTIKTIGEGRSMLKGYPKVQLREMTFQPGADFPIHAMDNDMVCSMTQGELSIDQEVEKFVANKGTIWTCAKGGKEGAKNNGKTVAVMRICDLLM